MRLTRAGTATAIVALLVLVALLPSADQTLHRLGSASFPVALGALLELLLLVLCAWTVPVLGLCSTGGPVARRACALLPRAVRGLLVAGVATGLAVGPAHADPAAPDPTPVVSVEERGLDGLSLPDRPGPGRSAPVPEASQEEPGPPPPPAPGAAPVPDATPEPSDVAPTVPPPDPDRTSLRAPGTDHGATTSEPEHQDRDPAASTVVVRPGDSLWRIAAASLGPGARDADVATATARWYRANRDVVGADPDLLVPGQRLVAPEDVA